MICTIQSFAEWYTAHAPWPPRAARVIGGTSAPDSKPITGGGGQSIAQTRAALVRLVYYQPSITLSYKERHFNECPLLLFLGSLVGGGGTRSQALSLCFDLAWILINKQSAFFLPVARGAWQLRPSVCTHCAYLARKLATASLLKNMGG